MENWADYLISGIWKSHRNGSNVISFVMLHKDAELDFEKGVKTEEQDVISLLKSGKKIITIRWDYNTKSWIKGAIVEYETREGVEFLCMEKKSIEIDKLENLISLNAFY